MSNPWRLSGDMLSRRTAPLCPPAIRSLTPSPFHHLGGRRFGSRTVRSADHAMELKQLRYFKRVADTGSVSKAAAALSVAQPAVSRQIASLEDDLGTPLFFRNGRGVTLTEAGSELYAHVQGIISQVEEAESSVRDTVGVARGHVLIGAPPTVVGHLAPVLAQRIQSSHPELSASFTEGFTGTLNEWLSNGTLDLAVLHDATRTQHFLTEPLMEEELAFVDFRPGPPDVQFAAVCEVPLALPRANHGVRLQLQRMAQARRLTLTLVSEIDSARGALSLVREQMAATVLPRGILGVDMPDVFVRRIVDPPAARTLLLATSSQRPVTQATRTVIRELKLSVRQVIEDEKWPGARRFGTSRAANISGDSEALRAA